MLKKCLSLFALVLLVMMIGFATAQDLPAGKWWKDPNVTQKLNLNEKQINQLDDLFARSSRNFINLRNKVEKEQLKLKMRLESKALDEGAVMKQVAKLEKERSALNEERVRVIVKMRQIVGYDAFNSMIEAVEKRAKKRAAQRTDGQKKDMNPRPLQPLPKDKSN